MKAGDSKTSKPKWLTVRNYLLVVAIIIFLFFLIFFSGLIKKNCHSDVICFNSQAYACKSSTVQATINNNLYQFTIYGPSQNNCVIESKLVAMAKGTPQDIVSKIEGKSMICKIPRSILRERSIVDINNVVDYCSGPLKEGLYEILLNRMYTLIVQNLGQILGDVKKEALNVGTLK